MANTGVRARVSIRIMAKGRAGRRARDRLIFGEVGGLTSFKASKTVASWWMLPS